MPSSRPNTIPTVVHLVRQLKPKTILDVGVGFGKWGHLFREYTDILEAEHDPARYRRENWNVRIDGIEGFPEYITEMHRFIYNTIHFGDARHLIRALGDYDLIFMGDILEHLEKSEGRQLLRDAQQKAKLAVILTTPKYETEQGNLCGNALERHLSLWKAKDFREFPGAIVKTIDQATLMVVLPKPGVGDLRMTPPKQLPAAAARKFHQAQKKLNSLVPAGATVIVVDEEQLRHGLTGLKTLPFLERSGVYWGPPPHDASAIAELERMKSEGATMIAFVWPCFWWLETYAVFHQYLRSHFRCAVADDHVLIFDLTRPVDRSE
jgi:hypothetical protein